METHTFHGPDYAFGGECNQTHMLTLGGNPPSISLISWHNYKKPPALKVDFTDFDIRSNEAVTIATPNASSLSARLS
jgi:hypothetical protein